MPEAAKPTTLLSALLAVQAEATKVKKTATNPAFKSKYVTLEALMDTVLPILNKHGLVWITRPTMGGPGLPDNVPALTYELVHVATIAGESQRFGEFARIQDTMPLLIDKQNPQGMGSALTYARRQSLMAVVGIVGEEDDDANKASQPRRQQPIAQAALEASPMSDTQLRNMWKALNDAPIPDEQKDLILAASGIEMGSTDVSLEQGRDVRRRLDEATV